MEEIRITNIEELFQYLNTIKTEFYFRGFSDFDFHMRPSLGRDGEDLIMDEIKIIQEFSKIPALMNLEIKVRNLQALLELGQHYGLPTRLLDWTTNPFVALFFALGGNIHDNSSVYIALISRDNTNISSDWSEINEIAPAQLTLSDWASQTIGTMGAWTLSEIENFELFKTNINHPLFEEKFSLFINEMSDKMLIKYQINPFNERIKKQDGLFTVHKDVSTAISDSLIDELIAIEFDSNQKESAIEMLKQVYRINKDETIPDPPDGSDLASVKEWCEKVKFSYPQS